MFKTKLSGKKSRYISKGLFPNDVLAFSVILTQVGGQYSQHHFHSDQVLVVKRVCHLVNAIIYKNSFNLEQKCSIIDKILIKDFILLAKMKCNVWQLVVLWQK